MVLESDESQQGWCLLAGQRPSTKLHANRAWFLAVVVVVVFVSAPLLCGWQALAQSLQASQSTALGGVSAGSQSSISGAVSTSAVSENGRLGGLLLSDVSDDVNEDDDAFDPTAGLGMLCFVLLMLSGQRPSLADREGSAKPYSIYCSVLERPG